MLLHICFVGAVASERGISTLGPPERLSGAAPGRAARRPSQSQRHQRGAGPGLFPSLQLSPRRPLPPQPVQHSQQAVPAHWCVRPAETSSIIPAHFARCVFGLSSAACHACACVLRYLTGAAARLCGAAGSGPRPE